MNDMYEQIDRLLHDAEHADSGAKFAASIGHRAPAKQLGEKRDALLAKANQLDPEHTAPSWEDIDLALARRPTEGV